MYILVKIIIKIISYSWLYSILGGFVAGVIWWCLNNFWDNSDKFEKIIKKFDLSINNYQDINLEFNETKKKMIEELFKEDNFTDINNFAELDIIPIEKFDMLNNINDEWSNSIKGYRKMFDDDFQKKLSPIITETNEHHINQFNNMQRNIFGYFKNEGIEMLDILSESTQKHTMCASADVIEMFESVVDDALFTSTSELTVVLTSLINMAVENKIINNCDTPIFSLEQLFEAKSISGLSNSDSVFVEWFKNEFKNGGDAYTKLKDEQIKSFKKIINGL